jgi:membrane protein DedA with SNARE-associated domain
VRVVVWTALAIVLVGTVLIGVLDYFEVSLDADAVVQTIVNRPELLGVLLVTIEEAGVPLPVSGDLLIMYSAARVARSPSVWLALGLAFEVAVLIGASFLFAISRRWGSRFLYGAPGKALRLSPKRIKQVEGWFKRYGVWAVIFVRYVPGFRVAVTVVSGSFQMRYPMFITGVAISAAFWIAGFMALGLLVGPQAQQLLSTHKISNVTILVAVAAIVLLYIVGRVGWQRMHRVAS